MVVSMHSIALIVALGSTTALGQDAPPEPVSTISAPTHARLLLNTAVLGAGIGITAAGAYNLTQASEAYDDYLSQAAGVQDDSILVQEVRPRQVVGIAELGLGVAAMGAGTALWLTIPNYDGTPDRAPAGRWALNGAVLGTGAGLGIAAVYNYGQARRVYGWYLETENPAVAAQLYDEQLPLRRRAAAIEGALSIACLGAGAVLWLGTDQVTVTAGPGMVGLNTRW